MWDLSAEIFHSVKSKIGLLGGKICSQRAVNWWKRPERGKLSNLSKKPRLSVVRANFGGSGAKRKLEAHNQVHHKCCALHFLFFSHAWIFCVFCLWHFPPFPCLGFLCIYFVFGLWHFSLVFVCVFGLWHFPPFPACICCVFVLWHFPFFQLGLSVYVFVYLVFVALWQT